MDATHLAKLPPSDRPDSLLCEKIVSLLTAKDKQNVLLSGPGGTGKSFLIRKIAVQLTKEKIITACTATTGIAAINLTVPAEESATGVAMVAHTLHSWSGIGLGNDSVEMLVEKIRGNKRYKDRWQSTSVLIIDEISMMGASLFDKLDAIGRMVRCQRWIPFGGLTLLISGDFLQLPPVKEQWVFESTIFQKMYFRPIILEEPKRYNDISYFKFLLRMRKGEYTEDDIKFLESRVHAYDEFVKAHKDDALVVKPTMLYSKRADVDNYNKSELNKLPGQSIDYNAKDVFNAKVRYARREKYQINADDTIPAIISLKVGAQVMLKANLDVANGRANGSRGVVIEVLDIGAKVKWLDDKVTFVEYHNWEQNDDDGTFSRTQIPLILAWAITTHKCIAANTIISTKDGLRRIRSLLGNGEVPSGWYDLNNVDVHTVMGIDTATKIYKGEEEDSIRVTTSLGFVIEGSYRHPLLVKDKKNAYHWVTLPNIKKGDLLTLKGDVRCGSASYVKVPPNNKDKSLPSIINEDICYIMGLLAGGGSIVNNTTIIYDSREKELVDIYKAIIEKNFDGVVCTAIDRPDKGRLLYNWALSINNKIVYDFMSWCDIAYSYVPWSVLENTKECHIAFIKALFDTNGDVGNTIHLTSKAPQLLVEVQIMLANLGIISTRKVLDKERLNNQLQISKENAHKYMKIIGFNCSKKESKGLSLFGVASKRNEQTVDGGIFYDKVTNIEYSKCLMYDLEVPSSHSFIAACICNHNCQGCTLDTAVADIGTDIFAPGQAYVSLSRVRNSKGLFLSGFDKKSIIVDEEAVKFVDEIEVLSKLYDNPDNIKIVARFIYNE